MASALPADCCRVLISAGQGDEAERFLTGMVVSAARDQDTLLTGRAIVAEGKGQIKEARDLYQEVAHRWADYGFVLEEGQAYLGLARCLLALDDRESATEPLQKAQAIFSRLGAVPLVNETDTYLQQTEAAS